MELILQNNLQHQQLPVDAVGDALKELTWDKPKDFYANPIWSMTNPHQLKGPLNEVWRELKHKHPYNTTVPEDGAPLNIDVKMETGTGKTYVYTKTIYELHQRYGLNKFIVCVPSLPIKAGAEQFLGDLYVQRHFHDACGYRCDMELGVLEAIRSAGTSSTMPLPIF